MILASIYFAGWAIALGSFVDYLSCRTSARQDIVYAVALLFWPLLMLIAAVQIVAENLARDGK